MTSESLEAIQIVEVNSQGNVLTLNTNKIEHILNHSSIRDRSLVVVSITGAIRKGKSFMLNFFIRYLKSTYNTIKIQENWIGDENEPLTGFSWRGGSERNTIGVLVWPEIYTHDYKNGKNVAIMLVDTQGTFDSKTTFDGNVTIFALSAMISSVQIYNITNNLQEDHLQYLALFTEYGKLALENPLNKPFQNLLILIRDWFYPYEASYGYEGGRIILNRALSTSNLDDTEKRVLRENITACFDDIDCFLMPYPGLAVATSSNFNGSIQEIDEDFVRLLKDFVPSVLQPENLKTKTVNGLDIRAQDFIYYLRSYMNVLTGNTLPTPKTILSATAEAQNLAAVSVAKENYGDLMEKSNSDHNYLNIGQMLDIHRRTNDIVIKNFEDTPKLQSADRTPEEYETQLEKDLKKRFNYYLIRNEKNRPDLKPKIKELINAITNEKSISDDLNARNTKLILDIINTMNENAEEYRQKVDELIQIFKENQNKGFDYMQLIEGTIKLIPHIIAIIALF